MSPLVEREAELALLDRLLGEASEGRGSMVVLEGPLGVGKTRLISEAVERAEARGATGLRARAGELERGFSHGVVRQLFEAAVASATAEERVELFAGAAGLAAPLFALEMSADAPGVDPSFGTLHGLFWLTANLAERADPLVMSVDDVHWCDHASLRFLVYLSRRLKGLRVLLVVGTRQAEPRTASSLLDELTSDPFATVVRPELLSVKGVAALLTERLQAEPDPGFSSTVHDVSGGNPLLVKELLAAALAEGIEPTASGVRQVDQLVPESVERLVLRRLSNLDDAAIALAKSVATLGDDVELAHAAELAGLDLDEAAIAADTLRRIDILDAGDRLGFAHPVVRGAVYASQRPPERERAHARAADLLVASGGAPARVAAHLLAVAPRGDPQRVSWLREAGRRALAQGAPEAAASYLARALAEPPADAERGAVLLDLGLAEARTEPRRAIAHLAEALELTDDPRTLADAAAELANSFFWSGRPVEAVETLRRVEARVADEGVARRLEAELIWLSAYYPETYTLGRERLARHRPEDCGDDLAGRQLLGLLASAAARAGESPSDALKLAQSALAGGVLLREHRTPAFTVPVSVLVYLDRFDEALAVYGDALDRARRTGSAFLFVMFSVLRSALRLRRGELAEAEADAHDAITAGAEYGSWAQPVTLLADVLIEQGDTAAAVEAFDRARPEQLPNAWELCFLENRRGRLRILQDRLREGVEDLLTAGERLRSLGCVNPAYAAWRSEAALALARLDQQDQALALAREEVELARVWKAPRTLGKALCSAGLVEPGDTGLERLHEAVAVLADSPAVLERARALTELGAALRRTNRRAAAREHLRAGLELAERCGARLLAERARDEVVATGARPRRAARTGAEALTPSERRVARLAAGGQTNRAIAQALFVTPKTVQVHLSHAYQKLGVRSRSQLEGALWMAADERAGRSE